MGTLFGTDGIRGEANRHPMDAMTAFAVGQAVTRVLRKEHHTTRVVIGKDTRLSGYMLESALESGVTSMGGVPYLVGVLPTPGIAFMTESMRADAGVVISASHNPYQDNGIKVFSGAGFKLSDAQEAAIEELILGGKLPELVPPPHDMGRAYRLDDATGRYVVFLKNTFPRSLSMEGLKVVLDTANGATYKVAPEAFTELGADVTVIHNTPDGLNINKVKNDLVVSTIMSNMGLGVAAKKYGFTNHAAKVGDRYVLEDMQRLGAVIGGEESGHTIFLDHHTTGDGILTAMQLLAAMLKAGKPLSELAKQMDVFPQKLINVDVQSKPDISTVPAIVAAIKAVEAELKDQGRVLVRYSGTQNMCRVMVEGPTKELTDKYAAEVADVVKAAIG